MITYENAVHTIHLHYGQSDNFSNSIITRDVVLVGDIRYVGQALHHE